MEGGGMTMSLEAIIAEGLKELSLTVSVAESCTGGLVGSRLTDIAGSSNYFLGGIIAYSNGAKVKLLDVRRETLAGHGAVSEPAAREMAAGVRKCFGADIGLAVTGIAGPGGATKDKPVGLMWLALAAEGIIQARSIRLTGDRLQNKAGAAEALLALFKEYIDSLLPD
jgi:PncC family amidohydrolase